MTTALVTGGALGAAAAGASLLVASAQPVSAAQPVAPVQRVASAQPTARIRPVTGQQAVQAGAAAAAEGQEQVTRRVVVGQQQ